MLAFPAEQVVRRARYRFVPVRLLDGNESFPIFGPMFHLEDEAQEWCDEMNDMFVHHSDNLYQVASVTYVDPATPSTLERVDGT
jgi:hypothetical protein